MDQKSPEAFRTISEVADWLGVPTHVLRFWESRFSQVKPVKRAGGRRYYRPSDMELLGGIRKLLHDDGMTIRGVQKLLREHGIKHVAAMSPSLDMGADEKDITPDNVVDLSDRRGARDEPEIIAEAEIVAAEDRGEAQEPERRFPFDDEPSGPAPDQAEPQAPQPELTDPGPAPVSRAAEPDQAPIEAALPPQDKAAIAPETGMDIADPFPEPEAMDFLSHAAPPESRDPETASSDDADIAPHTQPATLETDPDDAMSSPDALAFAAHGGEPDLAEDTAQEPAEPSAEPAQAPLSAAAESPAELDQTPDTASPPAPISPPPAQSDDGARAAGSEPENPDATAAPEPTVPALAMPAIDADPEDDDREAGALLAARLRGLRAASAEVDFATLQALGDRLDEIQRRFAGRGGAAGGL